MSWVVRRKKTSEAKAGATVRFGDYRNYLRCELENRKKLSPHYSLRDLAKHIGISASQLSRVLNGQRGLSKASARKVCKSFGIQGVKAQRILLHVSAQSGRSQRERFLALHGLSKKTIKSAQRELEERHLDVVSWSDQVREFDLFNPGVNLFDRRLLFHRAKACGLETYHFKRKINRIT